MISAKFEESEKGLAAALKDSLQQAVSGIIDAKVLILVSNGIDINVTIDLICHGRQVDRWNWSQNKPDGGEIIN